MILIGGGQEELGWRGYILDPIEERLGPVRGNLVLGAVWGFWHLPLFFLPFSGQANTPFAGFIILTIGWSWIFAWIREASGRRIWSGPYAHGLANTSTFLFPTLIPASGVMQVRYWLWVTLVFVVGLLVSLARQRRQAG
jgi:membrane protease YdiL (CAAX protease family)